MPKNGKTSNSQIIEKQRKFFLKNFKKTLYKNVRLFDTFIEEQKFFFKAP